MPCSANFAKVAPRHFLFVIALASFQLFGCKSGERQDAKLTAKSSPTTSVIRSGPDINLNCVVDRLQNPPDSFHYRFQDISDNSWSEEADVTPQMIDGSFKSGYMPSSTPLHGVPNEIPHQYQWAIGRMASLFALVHGTSAVVNQGPERVNGYDANRLSIDTSRASATEQGLYNGVLGPGGFEKGTVWVIPAGCPVKVVIDEETHAKDGTVNGKSHYEEAMVKM